MLSKNSAYGKCSKILDSSFLPKRPRQTVQTKIRLLLKKQSDQGLHRLIFQQATVNPLYNDDVCLKLFLTLKRICCYNKMPTISRFPHHNHLVKENIIQMILNAFVSNVYKLNFMLHQK